MIDSQNLGVSLIILGTGICVMSVLIGGSLIGIGKLLHVPTKEN